MQKKVHTFFVSSLEDDRCFWEVKASYDLRKSDSEKIVDLILSTKTDNDELTIKCELCEKNRLLSKETLYHLCERYGLLAIQYYNCD
ncbi:hypothetical protein BpHYR1_018474 [Brachionus plicatilis]|uniref:Uncharacterized protein n=1 Tax=Brachionus plicatilis TaxID=10195 RepID=A0A3M7Q228_BRAPC|nr:hypothetical protein BpHYR1_018474 [Brachionus plicatilis]